MAKFLFDFAFDDEDVGIDIPSKEFELTSDANEFVAILLDSEEEQFEIFGSDKCVSVTQITALEDMPELGISNNDVVYEQFDELARKLEEEGAKGLNAARALLERFNPAWGIYSLSVSVDLDYFISLVERLSEESVEPTRELIERRWREACDRIN